MIEGLDVSGWQRKIDWRAAREAGQRFVIVKATQGPRLVSKGLALHLPPARAEGLLTGCYHFADLRKPSYRARPRKQAAHFVKAMDSVGAISAGSIVPMLDLEWQDYGSKAKRAADIGERSRLFPARDVIDWALHFQAEVELRTGLVPGIYLGSRFWRQRLHRTDLLARYPLWLVSYGWAGDHPGQEPTEADVHGRMASAWPDGPHLWQWTGRGKLPFYGGKLDRNIALGGEARLSEIVTDGQCIERRT